MNTSMLVKSPSIGNSQFETGIPSKVLYRKQLSYRLKGLANNEYQLMLKLKFLASTLKRPSFDEVIDICEVFSDNLMTTINHYTLHVRELENSNINIASIVKPCEVVTYSGWVDRA